MIVFADITLSLPLTLNPKTGLSEPTLANCVDQPYAYNLGVTVLMGSCQIAQILTCVFHENTRRLITSVSSLALYAPSSDGSDKEPTPTVTMTWCDDVRTVQNISGVYVTIPVSIMALEDFEDSEISVYSGRFRNCNSTMLHKANQEGKSKTVRVIPCYPSAVVFTQSVDSTQSSRNLQLDTEMMNHTASPASNVTLTSSDAVAEPAIKINPVSEEAEYTHEDFSIQLNATTQASQSSEIGSDRSSYTTSSTPHSKMTADGAVDKPDTTNKDTTSFKFGYSSEISPIQSATTSHSSGNHQPDSESLNRRRPNTLNTDDVIVEPAMKSGLEPWTIAIIAFVGYLIVLACVFFGGHLIRKCWNSRSLWRGVYTKVNLNVP